MTNLEQKALINVLSEFANRIDLLEASVQSLVPVQRFGPASSFGQAQEKSSTEIHTLIEVLGKTLKGQS